MFRHSSSLVVSLLIHSLLLGGVFYSYKYVSGVYAQKKQHKEICIELSCLCESSQKPQEKKVTPKIKPQVKPKPKPKPKPTPKPIQAPEQVILVNDAKEIKKEESTQKQKPQEEISEVLEEESVAPSKSTTKLIDSKEVIQKSSEEVYKDENIEIITKLLQDNLYYPRSARKRGIQGGVVVKFTLSKDGEVLSPEVIESEYDVLSRGAIETIESISGEFPKPKERLTITLPINYTLK